MPLNLDTLAPEARDRLIAIGRGYSSQSTLSQATRTLNGLSRYGERLVRAGFSAADGAQLGEAKDALIDAGIGRETARTTRKHAGQGFVKASRDARAVRLRIRAVARRAVEVLEAQGDAASKAAASLAIAELARTSTAPEQAEALAAQLDSLRALFGDATIAGVTADRGGPEVVADALARASALRASFGEKTQVPGTPAETQHLDLLDGIIVQLARAARRAARSVAKEEGDPAIAALFELVDLDGQAAGVAAKKPEKVGA